MPTRSENTGSVMIHVPKKLMSTVAWPIHAAVMVALSQVWGSGR